jgi:murein tripeptide amidase MpaA
MNSKDYKDILNKKDNYIENTHEYEKLEYNFETKLHYSEIEDYLNNLNKSEIVKLENIGKSVDNRNIYSVEIGKGTKTLLVDANIHAAETANTLILLKYMITIVNKYESNDSKILNLLDNYKIVVLPCINPDGYEIYNFGIESLNNKSLWIYKNKDTVDFDNFKFNANGIDINRNMPTENAGLYYKKYDLISSVSLSKTTDNGAYFGGTTLGSEPETRSLMYFMLKHYKNTTAYVNMHSQGRVIYQGKPNLNERFNSISYDLATTISNYNNYTIKDMLSEEVGEGNDGSATDFMSELANGLKFSDITGRLSMSSYENDNVKLVYSYPVVTLETLDRYTRDTKYYSDEYSYRNYYNMFTSLISKTFE